MPDIYSCIVDRVVYPILIKNSNCAYLTLYYYTEHSDSILHTDSKSLLYFKSQTDMEHFCEFNNLTIEGDIFEYDFDTPITNPIDYRCILENWNLMNTIASTLGMLFEGDREEYNEVYDLLFRLNTPMEPIRPTYDVADHKLRLIQGVFQKKDRFFERFCCIANEGSMTV